MWLLRGGAGGAGGGEDGDCAEKDQNRFEDLLLIFELLRNFP